MERGGPTVQAGILYQNSIAALYLGDLLSFDGEAPDRVVEVRIEAPTHVDDTVVAYADGRRLWIQAKLALEDRSAAWEGLWHALEAQRTDAAFRAGDRLCLYLGDDGPLARTLRECAARTKDSDATEWRGRLTAVQRRQVDAIEALLGRSAWPAFERLDVVIADGDTVDRLARTRMPLSDGTTTALHAILTTLVSGGGGRREMFRAPQLRRRLRAEHSVRLDPPGDWGLPAYLSTISANRISVPGTPIGGDPAEMFAWPRTARTEAFRRDFDDEQMLELLAEAPSAVDLRVFPAPDLAQAIVHAGPGFGKSALLIALAQRIAAEGLLAPAVIHLAALAESDEEVVSYLNTRLNADFDVRIRWERLIETGAAVILFDGLDEVPVVLRARLIARLARFVARRRETPWLLTVRDPALVPAQLDAQKIELLPLLDDEMKAFVRQIHPGIAEVDLERLAAQLDAYPDVRRLARIPLFLALIAAMQVRGEDLPQQRGDLIEAYLKTLFRPEEHKETVRAVDPDRLRLVLQGLAYDLLGTGGVGAEERDVRRRFAAGASGEATAERLFDDALRCGVLQRQTSTRLRFPFPIVQEYLAAQDLVERHPEEIAARAAAGIDRPWAQSIQFALERIPDATAIVRDLLSVPDDMFASTARLMARCIVNGMRCGPDLRIEVGNRLVSAWPRQGYWTAQRIGQLLRDGWSQPLLTTLRAALHRRGLFHEGGEEILGDVADEALTRSVLVALRKGSHLQVHYGAFQPAINRVSAFAFDLYLAEARTASSDDDIWSAASAMRKLDGRRIDCGLLAQTVADEALDRTVRLASLELMDDPPVDLVSRLVQEAMEQSDYREHWAALHLLARMPDAELRLATLLRSAAVDVETKRGIIEHIGDALPDLPQRIAFLTREADKTDLAQDLHLSLRLRAMTFGDAAAFECLVESFGTLPEKALRRVLWCVNKVPDLTLGRRLLAELRARVTEPAERVSRIDELLTGASHNMEIFGHDTAGLTPARAHPGFAEFVSLLVEWRDQGGFDTADAIHIETLAAEAQLPGATEQLRQLTLTAIQSGDHSVADTPLSIALQAALRRLSTLSIHLPLESVSVLLSAKDDGLRSQTVSHISGHGTRQAVDILLSLHGSDTTYRSNLVTAIETAANRAGLKVIEDGGGFRVAED
ncbi:MAG: NACHT domain-containing protein [Caulobacter sp.]|nr:NACHT domain-containing protein [Caulobacter sp.]